MLRESLNEALKTALKERDQKSVSTLRMVLAALKDRDIAARPQGIQQIPEPEILSLLQGMIKQARKHRALQAGQPRRSGRWRDGRDRGHRALPAAADGRGHDAA